MRRVADLVRDLVIDLSARRAKVLLILTAVAFASGALTASVGLARMAAAQIDADLAASPTDRMTVERVAAAETDARTFTPEAVQRVAGVPGVLHVGLVIALADGIEAHAPSGARTSGVRLGGATSGYLDVLGVPLHNAWVLDAPPVGNHVAAIGEDLAREVGVPLGLDTLHGYAIEVDDTTYQVIEVLPGPELSRTVLLPYEAAVRAAGSDGRAQLHVRTEPGAARPVSLVVREAVDPVRPDALSTSRTSDLSALRTGVSDQLSRFVGAIGLLLVVLTALLIANSMIVSVVSRTAEIGLRRAMGASRLAIAVLFLTEAVLIGLFGGAAGAALGCAAVVVVALVNDWEAVLAPWYLLLAPGVGVVIGVLGACYPALRAARTSPATAVRAD